MSVILALALQAVPAPLPTEQAIATARAKVAADPAAWRDLTEARAKHAAALCLYGRAKEGVATFDEILPALRKRIADEGLATDLYSFAAYKVMSSQCHAASGQFDTALGEADEATGLLRQFGLIGGNIAQGLPLALTARANALRGIGQGDRAVFDLAEALPLYRRLLQAGNRAFVTNTASTLFDMGAIFEGSGRKDDAIRSYRDALATLRSNPDPSSKDVNLAAYALARQSDQAADWADLRHSIEATAKARPLLPTEDTWLAEARGKETGK